MNYEYKILMNKSNIINNIQHTDSYCVHSRMDSSSRSLDRDSNSKSKSGHRAATLRFFDLRLMSFVADQLWTIRCNQVKEKFINKMITALKTIIIFRKIRPSMEPIPVIAASNQVYCAIGHTMWLVRHTQFNRYDRDP